MPTPKWTKETAPRAGGKAGRTWRASTMRANAELLAAAKDITPLDVLKGFAADVELDESLRITAATAAARYVHKAMPQAVEHSGTVRLHHTFAEAVSAEDEGVGT